MDYSKGSCFKLASTNQFKGIVMIIGESEEAVICIQGYYENIMNVRLTSYFKGHKYVNRNADLLNSVSWKNINYNGVKYMTFTVDKNIFKLNFTFIERWNVPNFFPLSPGPKLKNIEDFIELEKDNHTFYSDKSIDTDWGYVIGVFNLFENFTDSKKLSYE